MLRCGGASTRRRLAAIFAGDIAGYSRLMGADEEGTLRQLKAHRKELVDPKITEVRERGRRRPLRGRYPAQHGRA
jgi:class 3 adenylate cyclase